MNEVRRESQAIGHLEAYHLRSQRNQIYTSLEDMADTEWFWSQEEIEEFEWLWKKDVGVKEIAKELGRSEVAILFLSLDRMHKRKIKPRNWNLW